MKFLIFYSVFYPDLIAMDSATCSKSSSHLVFICLKYVGLKTISVDLYSV